MVTLGATPLQQGNNRRVYALLDHSRPAGQQECVAKFSKRGTDRNALVSEVQMQMKCKSMAQEFSRRCPSHAIDFLVPCLMELNSPMGTQLVLVEPLLKGRFTKYSNNYGYVSPETNSAAHAFSHFTWDLLGRKGLVCDIQGLTNLFTDPQIHTNEGNGVFHYGEGDMGVEGVRRFFSSHRCNELCHILGLGGRGAHSTAMLPQMAPSFQMPSFQFPNTMEAAVSYPYSPTENSQSSYGGMSVDRSSSNSSLADTTGIFAYSTDLTYPSFGMPVVTDFSCIPTLETQFPIMSTFTVTSPMIALA